MQVHDYHLQGYEVLDSGESIILHLVYDYPGQPKRESTIRFSGVELYHFTHTSGAIICGIEPVSVDDILKERRGFIEASAAEHGVRGWREGIDNYRSYLQKQGASAWELTSSIGFDGFVIAQSAEPMRA